MAFKAAEAAAARFAFFCLASAPAIAATRRALFASRASTARFNCFEESSARCRFAFAADVVFPFTDGAFIDAAFAFTGARPVDLSVAVFVISMTFAFWESTEVFPPLRGFSDAPTDFTFELLLLLLLVVLLAAVVGFDLVVPGIDFFVPRSAVREFEFGCPKF